MIRANLSGERCNDVCSEYDEVSNDNSPLANYMNCENVILSKKISVIWEISSHLCDIWRPIGRVLFNNESILTNIEEEYCNEDEREKAYQMLLKWSRQHGQDATLKKLLAVLLAMKKDEIVDAIILQVNDAASPKPSPSCSERAKKLEEKSRAKWQKNALKNFKKTLQLYEERLQEMERVQQQHFITKEAQEIKDSLRDIDRNYFADQLAQLHAKIEELEYSGQRCSFRGEQLRVIADQLYKLDKTLGKHCESLSELRVLELSSYK